MSQDVPVDGARLTGELVDVQPQLHAEQRALRRPTVVLGRLSIVLAILAAWQYSPNIGWLRDNFHFVDPFFISSPRLVAVRLWQVVTSSDGQPSIWPYLADTVKATLVGGGIGILTGVVVGLLVSNDRRLRQLLTPFIMAANALPKIVFIPIIIIVFGESLGSTVAVSAVIVFFVVFFNAYAGGRSVPVEMVQNARLLGSSSFGTIVHIRAMYVVLWTFEALPLAIAQALLAVVTAEILSGADGVGELVVVALTQVDATLTFTVAIVLSVLGGGLVGLTEIARGKVLHWWPGAQG